MTGECLGLYSGKLIVETRDRPYSPCGSKHLPTGQPTNHVTCKAVYSCAVDEKVAAMNRARRVEENRADQRILSVHIRVDRGQLSVASNQD